MQFRLAILAIVVGLAFSPLPASAAITHTTTNLNLRAGPGTHHRVKAIIPAGAPIDIESLRGQLVLHVLGWTCRVRQTSIPDAPRDSRSSAARSCDPCPQP